MSDLDTPVERGRTGRPRAAGGHSDRPPREELVAVASRLFAEQGVGATTMSQIARGAGLRQSSVYYYFKDKEAILEQIASSANAVILSHLERVERDGGPAAVRLYRFIVLDVCQLCTFPFDINEIYRLSALQDQRFATFWAERDRIISGVERLIDEGVQNGEFVVDDVRLAALVVTSTDEGTQNWHRPLAGHHAASAVQFTSATIASFVADLTLGGLLANRSTLAAVRQAAEAAGVD
jgi:AcrR family transcriptional regulator